MHKRFLPFLLFIFLFQIVSAQNEFITIWKPSNTQAPIPSGVPSGSSDHQIWLPVQGDNYTVYWEEVGYPSHNATITNVTATLQTLIDFGTPINPIPQNATYRVKISNGNGSFHRVQFSSVLTNGIVVGDTKKIINVEQWGTNMWSSMERAFAGCSSMDITATDTPDLSNVDNMKYMFFNCSGLIANPAINNWNVSNIIDMEGVFMACSLFNQPLGNWNTSNVTNMAYTFFSATVFNQPIGNWNTSKVIQMVAMFNSAEAFNQPIGSWDLSENKSTEFMFSDAHAFNQPIGSWNISKLVETDHMFSNATSFNQEIGNWDTGNITVMSGMFNGAVAFNQSIGNWNVGNVIDMREMFQDATSFNQNIGNWNTSKTLLMMAMFNGASAFNQNIGNWNVSHVINMSQMFKNTANFNQNIGGWNTGSVTLMPEMFNGAVVFNQNIGNWNVSNVTNMNQMFQNATSFNQNIGSWNTGSVTLMTEMFNGAVPFNQNIGNWNVSNVTNMNQMFQNATSFNQNIGGWNTGNAKFLNNMFNHATSFNQNLELWNLGSLLSAQNIFLNSGINCQNYNKILQGWSLNAATPNNINLGNTSPLVYSTLQASNARNNLINNKGWTITGDTYNTECALLATSDPVLTGTNGISIYPNPATDFIYIKNVKAPGHYKVLDTAGRIVIQNLLNNEKIDVSSLTKGNYILQITSKDKTQAIKFIKN
ncbi:hypothetical protein CEY12_08275 [Chryseobacterium sp. T16E-39]|uniref:BspA family leucine-rich repeat surface protein n=1 Tax=Chryseobacterium sp. T16E-39 TaxID=2015076 RepID=UPI000B5B2E22|nr:BspA family leucine-rich repeat surface protein [Chryseobacterium sp. T16E-39]ASK30110.1 hypothetical protein CEY12_08275 [Chryseobacterium sp. T16E-39]